MQGMLANPRHLGLCCGGFSCVAWRIRGVKVPTSTAPKLGWGLGIYISVQETKKAPIDASWWHCLSLMSVPRTVNYGTSLGTLRCARPITKREHYVMECSLALAWTRARNCKQHALNIPEQPSASSFHMGEDCTNFRSCPFDGVLPVTNSLAWSTRVYVESFQVG